MSRFTIKSIFIAVCIIAVVVCAYRVNQQASVIRTQNARLVALETQRRVQFRTLQFLSKVNSLEKHTKEDVEVAIWVVEHMKYLRRDELRELGLSKNQIEQRLMFKTNAKLFPMDSESKLEVLSLAYSTNSSPGGSGLVLALFRGNKLIDCVTRNKITRQEWSYKTTSCDFDGNGTQDIVVEINPGIWNERKENYNIAYKATEQGLELLIVG